MLVKYRHFVQSKLEGMANTILLSPLKLLQQKDLFQKSNPLLKNFWSTAWRLPSCRLEFLVIGRKALRLTTNLPNKNSLHCDHDCVVFSLSTAGVQRGWSTYNLIVTVLRKKMLETTKEKMMHISSSSASVREFDASKLVVYWKSMSFEILICFATLSHQFTM